MTDFEAPAEEGPTLASLAASFQRQERRAEQGARATERNLEYWRKHGKTWHQVQEEARLRGVRNSHAL